VGGVKSRPARIFLVVGLLLCGGYFLVPRGRLPQSTLYDLLSLAAVVAIVAGVRVHRPARRLPWYYLAAGQLLFTFGDLAWDYYEFVRHIEAPFPGLADVFYLAGYPFVFLGLALIVRGRGRRSDWGGMVDAAIIATGLGVLSWVFLMLPYASDPSYSLSEKAVSIAYPLMDVFLLAVVARLLVGQGPRVRAYWLLSGSLVCLMVADAVFAQMVLADTYLDGSLVDVGWLLSFVLLGAAALHPSMRDLSNSAPGGQDQLTRRRLGLLTAASLMAPAALVVQDLRGDHRGLMVIAFGAATLFLLVLVRVAALNRDVRGKADELRTKGARLAETEARFRTVVEHIPAVTYLEQVERGDTVAWTNLYISPQIESLLGYTPEEWIAGRLWEQRLHGDDRDRVLDADRHRLVSGEPFRQEYRLTARDGRDVWIYEAIEVIRDQPDDPVLWQGIMFDVTDRKKAEQALQGALDREREAAARLRALDEMKNTFLHAVSHELRTPLSAILGSALTLDRQDLTLPQEDQRDLIRRLASNARRLDRLLGDLLDLDRLDRGIIGPSLGPTDVGELIRRVVAESGAFRGRSVEVEAPAGEVQVDAAKLERIVENLLVNAVKHTPPGTSVWVRASAENGALLLIVEDAGPGIPEELRERIFEPFLQGTITASHSPGVGIGLSLVARFAKLHGGRAWVEHRPGGGASFHVSLATTGRGRGERLESDSLAS
jgi:PAS domain S-box-containing protein